MTLSNSSVHPLGLSAIARSTPTYHCQEARRYSVPQNIAVPNEALQQFGVDIYADERFDTWILFTVAARLDNNCWSNPTCRVLSPLFSLFNHSCEPNVGWASSTDHCGIKVTTKRDIKAGEQLYLEYDSFVRDKPVQQRRERLSRWIEGPCMCTRCVREEKAEAREPIDRRDPGELVSTEDV